MKIMNEDLLSSRELRDKCSGRYEVLEKVKQLLLIPGTEMMSVKQLAEYYEVGKEAIEAVYTRFKEELVEDGMKNMGYKSFLNLQVESLEHVRGKTLITLPNKQLIEVPNRGLKVFPRRAILRIGMLLRDSEVAKEIRTQLYRRKNFCGDQDG